MYGSLTFFGRQYLSKGTVILVIYVALTKLQTKWALH